MLAHSLPSSGSSGEEGDVESEMDSCEAAVQKEDPPPVLKCDWKVAAGKPPAKRPASSKLFKKPSSCKAMGPGDAGVPIHTLLNGCATTSSSTTTSSCNNSTTSSSKLGLAGKQDILFALDFVIL